MLFSKIYLCLKANSFYLTLKMTAMPKKNANFWIPNIFTERLLLGGGDNFQPSEDFIRGWLEPLCPLRDGQIWEWVIWMGSGRYGWSGGYRWRWG